MTLGQVLVELRKEKCVSMERVKIDTGMSPSLLSLVERDEGKMSFESLNKLSKYYDTTIYDIFREVSGYKPDRDVFDTLLNYILTPNEVQTKRWTHAKIRKLYKMKAS